MTALSTIARMLGIRTDLAEDALHSESAARAGLSRRNLFLATGAMAAGSVFSIPDPGVLIEGARLYRWAEVSICIGAQSFPGMTIEAAIGRPRVGDVYDMRGQPMGIVTRVLDEAYT